MSSQVFINITMNNKSDFFINLAKMQAIMYRRLDSSLWWLSFNEYIILKYLDESDTGKLRRIDLADLVWLTASWVTRLLLPMEKIWLVTREVNPEDARVSYVVLAKWWKQKLDDAKERMDLIWCSIIPDDMPTTLDSLNASLQIIARNLSWR